MELAELSATTGPRISLHSVLGVHGAAAAVFEFALDSPIVAGVIAAAAAIVTLQWIVLAACTRRVPLVDC